MMTHETAFELSRQRLAEASKRADFAAVLGQLPKPQAIFPFRRQVISTLPATVEVRCASDKERVRRLLELSASEPARKAS